MICKPCKDGDHQECKKCECQHRDVNVISDHLAEHCRQANCPAHGATSGTIGQ